jgi:A/G-specific adenine glycosylase
MSGRPAVADDGGFARCVVEWQRCFGRHDLPWQGTRDPYRIWLSEIMLQQTQVATVIPYFRRFTDRFADVAALAAAAEDEVLSLWSGLGYYARARNLHRAARDIVSRHHGEFPRRFEDIVALPGVGASTAGAIAVFAFGQSHPILDGNVKRVLARCFGVEGFPGEAGVAKALWALSERLLPPGDTEAYTQGLMDLGAGVCTRTRPQCSRCPLVGRCVAHRTGRIADLPGPRPRRILPRRRATLLVLLHEGDVLLEKRAATGIWGGLWSFPEVTDAQAVARECLARFGVDVATVQPLPAVEHGFTHYQLTIDPLRCEVARRSPGADAPGRAWLPLAEAMTGAIPAPVRVILGRLASVGLQQAGEP